VVRATPHGTAALDITLKVPHHSAVVVNGHCNSVRPQAHRSAGARPENRLRRIGIECVACNLSLIVYTTRIANLFGAECQLVHCTSAVLVEKREGTREVLPGHGHPGQGANCQMLVESSTYTRPFESTATSAGTLNPEPTAPGLP
jgi:hypothetical protein